MNIALIGGTGFVGSAVLAELLQRGHKVTALARSAAKYAPSDKLKVVTVDAQDAAQVAAALVGQDAVISAYNPGWGNAQIQAEFVRGTRAISEGAKKAGVRLLVVGGAGSLFVAPGMQLVDTPQFPAEYKEGALGARQALKDLQGSSGLEWTFVSPPVFLAPGERTGKYRVGADEVLMDGDKPAGISAPDLAVAIVDEIESKAHAQKRFTVAGKS